MAKVFRERQLRLESGAEPNWSTAWRHSRTNSHDGPHNQTLTCVAACKFCPAVSKKKPFRRTAKRSLNDFELKHVVCAPLHNVLGYALKLFAARFTRVALTRCCSLRPSVYGPGRLVRLVSVIRVPWADFVHAVA